MAPLIAILAVVAATPAQPPSAASSWITPDDYPPAALRADAEGVVQVALSIDATGTLTDCRVERSSGNADLDTTTCALLRKRAKFAPARDASGQPTASIKQLRFRWEIPRDVLASHASRMTYSLDKDGRITGCAIAEAGEHDPDLTCSPQGIEDMAKALLSSPLDHYRNIAVLLAIETDQNKDVAALRSATGERKVIARAVFTVSPEGIVTDCAPVEAIPIEGRTMNMCNGPIKIGGKEFAPFPGGQPRKLTVSLEMSAEPR